MSSHLSNRHELDPALEDVGHGVASVHAFLFASSMAEPPQVDPGGDVLVHVVELPNAVGERGLERCKYDEEAQLTMVHRSGNRSSRTKTEWERTPVEGCKGWLELKWWRGKDEAWRTNMERSKAGQPTRRGMADLHCRGALPGIIVFSRVSRLPKQ